MRVWPGKPYPLGVRWDGAGVNVALYAEHALAVELCLYDQALGAGETARIPLRHRSGFVWHSYLPDLRPGQLYGFRVHGPWAPAQGHRCNAHKLLVDPWARAVTAELTWDDAVFGHAVTGADPQNGADDAMDVRDSAPFVPKGVVVDESFDWGGDRRPRTPRQRTTIYECHVRGLTMRHPEVPPEHRGRYLGLCAPPILEHLASLGVTAVELLPVQHFVSEHELQRRGLVNAWGYNPLAFRAPHAGYASGDRGQQVTEFKTMVRTLHAAGLEVILDVVFNHTAEGNQHGPTLSLRGIDNSAYYRLMEDDPRRYVDTTGCGNSLNTPHPRALQLVLDSLRTWAAEYRVDGFRFDLAPTLGRDARLAHASAFWDVVMQDPLLAPLKLIAEPWDLGPDGWRAGTFPPGFSEWNGLFRDTARRFWAGHDGVVPELASRLAGSSDVYLEGPIASVDYVTCHDGFTLADLVSHDRKHNEDNGEDNRDGTDANWSRNWGVEGPTDDPAINAQRDRVARSLLATAVFSQGITMLLGGDELLRSQRGNNNAYCQDNETSWVDWRLDDRRRRMLEFARAAAEISRVHPVLRRRSFFRGAVEPPASVAPPVPHFDVLWVRPDGQPFAHEDWAAAELHALGMLLPGAQADEQDELGRPLPSETLLLLMNGGEEPLAWTLPPPSEPGGWRLLLDTASEEPPRVEARAADPALDALTLAPQGLALLQFVPD